tara:strand:- start:129 stop:341 length:213 start_codon:yes stop_codon:yes gene_type:complete
MEKVERTQKRMMFSTNEDIFDLPCLHNRIVELHNKVTERINPNNDIQKGFIEILMILLELEKRTRKCKNI